MGFSKPRKIREFLPYLNKVKDVIDSCENLDQLNNAGKYLKTTREFIERETNIVRDGLTFKERGEVMDLVYIQLNSLDYFENKKWEELIQKKLDEYKL